MTDSKPTSLEALAHLLRCLRALHLYLSQVVRDWKVSDSRMHAGVVLSDVLRLAETADRWIRDSEVSRPVASLLSMVSVAARIDQSIQSLVMRTDVPNEDTKPKWHELANNVHGVESWARDAILELAGGANVADEIAQLRRDLEKAAREAKSYAESNADLRQRLELREQWARDGKARVESEFARRDAIQEAERAAYVESVRALALQRYRDVIRSARATADSTEGPVKA